MILSYEDDAFKAVLTGGDQPIIQNLGPGTLYVASTPTNITDNGLQLPAGAVYEFPKLLVDGVGQVWLKATTDDCDVRIMNVG